LQLNEFQLSKKYIEKSIAFGKSNNFISPYEMFYLGIIEFEIGNYTKAIEDLNISLYDYKNFADAKYYKALSLDKIQRHTDAQKLFLESKLDFKNGFTFNEGNSLYEQYPYQVSQFTYTYTEKFLQINNN
jgi:tetratricopeptide (TPR) repeat protein